MNKPSIQFAKVRDVNSPRYGTDGSNGIDFFVPNDMEWESTTINPQQSLLIPSGLMMNIPKDHALVALNKSGVCMKKILGVGAQLIDGDYQGELHLHVINHGKNTQTISRGEKLVQFMLVYAPQAELQETDAAVLFPEKSQRGEGRFGSTDHSENNL